MIKRILSCALALMMMAACAATAEEATVKQIFTRNCAPAMLEEYDSFAVSSITEGVNDVYYADDDLVFSSDDDFRLVRQGGREYEWAPEGYYGCILLGNNDGSYWDEKPFYIDEDETLQEFRLEDGKYTITTRLDDEHYFADPALGGYTELTYCADAETLQMLTYTITERAPDGTVLYVINEEMQVNVERPAECADLLSRLNATENYRTITIVLDPGTPQEQSASEKVVVGDFFAAYVCSTDSYDGFDEYYLDPECTQLYVDDTGSAEDITLYQLSANAY